MKAVQCTLIVEGSTSKAAAYCKLASHVYCPPRINNRRGDVNFAKRTVLLYALEQGSLVIKVEMRQPGCSSECSQHFVPGNPLVKNIMKKFNDEESADVVFDVSCCGTEDESKEPTKFYAHRLILKDGAQTLFDLSGSGETSLTPIPITVVEPAIFECLLSYVYGRKVGDEVMKNNAKAIINAADKYNVVNLKLEAEASLVSTTAFTVDNAKELLLYADEMSCALLKEAAMDFLVKNSGEAQKMSFGDLVPGNLMTDLFAAIEMDDSTRVGNLRERLHGKGLDVDGSRQAMIARLEDKAERNTQATVHLSPV